jgi:hypothetical protein
MIHIKERSFLSFFTRLFHNPVKKNQDTCKAKHKDSLAVAKKEPKKLFDLNKGGITYTSLYTQGVSLNTGVSGLYTLAHVQQGFDAFGLPLQAQATGVMDDGQFERNYSSYSVNFDVQTFQEGLRQRALNSLTNQEANTRNLLSKGHINLTDSMNAFESIRRKINAPDYVVEENICKGQLQKDEDSLKKNPNADTTELHGLKQKMTMFEQLKNRYEQLLAIKRNYSSIASKDTVLTNNEARFEKDKQSLSNPDNVKKLLSNSGELSGYEKFLMGFQKFSIGVNSEEISQFTLHNFVMKGVDIGYKVNDIYVLGGYGHEEAVVNPYLMTGINVPTYNRTVEYARVGIGGPEESNFYATVIQINDPGSTNALSENNWIIDVSKKIVCSKNLDFEGEVAQSFFTYLPNRADSNPLPLTSNDNSRLAWALRAHGVIPYSNTSIRAEYDNIGGDFITLGNQFLLSGAQLYRAEISQPIGSKFKLTLGGEHATQNLLSSSNSTQTNNWVDFSVQYKPSHSLTLQLKYSPRQFQQQEGTVEANNITSNINQISFTCNANNHFWGDEQYTTIFVGNFQYVTPDNSAFLAQNLNLTYYMFNETIALNSSHSITFSADESRNDWTGSLSQFIGEGAYNMNIKKSILLSGGLQWLQQPGIVSNAAGVIGSIGMQFKKWGKLSLQLNCRNNVDRPFEMNTAQVIISTNACILW